MKSLMRTLAAWTVVSLAGNPVPAGAQILETIIDPPRPGLGSYVCPPLPYEYELDEPMIAVRYLAADALEGRFPGTRGESCAAEFVAAMFARIGLEPAGEAGFYQTVPLASALMPHGPTGTGRNVIGLLRGSDPQLARSVVVIGAHYDHLGRGEFGSTGEPGAIHNGADDNASGVAAMLMAARRLADGPRPARSVLFIAFTGEELGLLGSAWYANHPTIPLASSLAMINLDMVGRLEDHSLIVYGMGTAPEWQEIVSLANAVPDIALAYEEAGYGPSDHTSFYANGLPVLHLFTNVHGDYHAPTDDWQAIDPEGLTRVAALTANLARELANRETRLTLIPGVGERERRAEGYGAWLGTIPDFTPVERGVLLAGVTAGSPAETAGLEKGDILIGLETVETPRAAGPCPGEDSDAPPPPRCAFRIDDLQDFTDALRAHRPGDEVLLRFTRNGEELSAEATLGDRADRPR